MGTSKKGMRKHSREFPNEILGISKRMDFDISLETTDILFNKEELTFKSDSTLQSSLKGNLDSALLVDRNDPELSKMQTYVKKSKKMYKSLEGEKSLISEDRSLDIVQSTTTVSEIKNREISLAPKEGKWKKRRCNLPENDSLVENQLKSDNLSSSDVKSVKNLEEEKSIVKVSEIDSMRNEKKHEGPMNIASASLSLQSEANSISKTNSSSFYTYQRKKKKLCFPLDISVEHASMELPASQATSHCSERDKIPKEQKRKNKKENGPENLDKGESLLSGSIFGSDVTDVSKLETEMSLSEISLMESVSVKHAHLELSVSEATAHCPEMSKAPEERKRKRMKNKKQNNSENYHLEGKRPLSDSNHCFDVPDVEKLEAEMSLLEPSKTESVKNENTIQGALDKNLIVASSGVFPKSSNDNSVEKSAVLTESNKTAGLTYQRKKKITLSKNNPEYDLHRENLDTGRSSGSNAISNEMEKSSGMLSMRNKKDHDMPPESTLSCKKSNLVKNYAMSEIMKTPVITYQRKKIISVEVADESETNNRPCTLLEICQEGCTASSPAAENVDKGELWRTYRRKKVKTSSLEGKASSSSSAYDPHPKQPEYLEVHRVCGRVSQEVSSTENINENINPFPSTKDVVKDDAREDYPIKTSIMGRKRWDKKKAEPCVGEENLPLRTNEDKMEKLAPSNENVENAVVVGTLDIWGNHLARCPASPQLPISHTTNTKLLILDLNGLLADIVSSTPNGYKADKRIAKKLLFKRPFCDGFLKFCFERFNVGVWSSRIKRNVESVVDYLMGEMKDRLLFCWDQSHCTETRFWTLENRNKPLVFKELKKLWDYDKHSLPWVKGVYNESNTLLLDDSPYKALRNPPNTGIFPRTYCFQDANDNSLGPGGDLRNYLEGLAMAQDVQKYVEQRPFGQNAITTTHPSWEFYLQVIGDGCEYPYIP